jgi:hypothetical protein
MKVDEFSIRGFGAHPNKRGLGISKSMLAIREFAPSLGAQAYQNCLKREVKK